MLLLLIAALTLETGFSLALSYRQLAHVARYRDAVPAAFREAVSLADHRRAADHTGEGLRARMLQEACGFMIQLAWLLAGFDWLYGLLAAQFAPGPWRSVIFILAFSLAGAMCDLPFGLYDTFVTEARFGFNRTTPARFAADMAKEGAIGLAISVPLLFGLFWIMRRGFGLWWLYAWAALVALQLALAGAYPRFIAPLFNRFTPLEEPLRGRVAALMRRCGFDEARSLFVMDASTRSSHGNAYFTGLGRAKRIVLFDTLIEKHTEAEIEAVLAHELGHFHHRHVLHGALRGALALLAAMACFALVAGQPWVQAFAGLRHRDDALALMVFGLWASALGPLTGFVGNWFSQRDEFQADRFARGITGARPLADALVKLQRDSAGTLTTDPLYAVFTASHPPVPLRVRRLLEA